MTNFSATVNISLALRNVVTIIGAVILLFISAWKLTLIMLAVVPLVAISGMFSLLPLTVVPAVIYARYMKQLSETLQKKLAEAAATAEEALSSIRTVPPESDFLC